MVNNKNTCEIGDDFELKSLEIIKKAIEEGQLGHTGKYAKIYTKSDKGYYSEKRKKEIYFDLTIEIWPPNANRYVLIYIIECKNYENRVPVSDLEEFHNKIQQVSGVNVKGIFITNSPLQEGAYNYAESIGMMVIQGESSEKYNIILHKSSQKLDNGILPLMNQTINNSLINENFLILERSIDKKIIDIFQENDSTKTSYNIDKLSKINIENIANNVLNKINPDILIKRQALKLTMFRNYITEIEKLSVIEYDDYTNTIGWCDINKKEIGINKSIAKTKRELFTLAHEYGHYILHKKLSIGQNEYNQFPDPEYNFRKGKYELTNPRNWIEWQANYFAISLILPKELFLYRLWKVQDYLKISRGKIYIDDSIYTINTFNLLVKRLIYYYDISKNTITNRFNEMNLVNNQSRSKSIGQIINEESFL